MAVKLVSHVAELFDELLVAPDEDKFTYRDRIVLVSNDGVEFFTHASIMSCASPLLRAFYHGKYDVSEAGTEMKDQVMDGSKYRGFNLKEADRVTLNQMLRFVYLDELPEASAQLGPLIRVCDFLQVERFKPCVFEIVQKAVDEKTLTKNELGPLIRVCDFLQVERFKPCVFEIVQKAVDEKTLVGLVKTKNEWRDLVPFLLEFDCTQAFEAIVEHIASPSHLVRSLFTTPQVPAKLVSCVIDLCEELLVAPDEQEFSYRDRIVLVSSDGVEIFTHASIMSRASPVLRTFYHGRYDALDAGSELASRVIDGSDYRSFRVKEADQGTLADLLIFLYLDKLPEASAQLGPLIRVCDFLQVERFKPCVFEIVQKAVDEKTLVGLVKTKNEWRDLVPFLLEFDCTQAFEAIVEHIASPSHLVRSLFTTPQVPAKLVSYVIDLFDELLVAPDEQEFSYRDRIVLVSSDGVEIFTHASIMSRASPLLRTFYHGKYDALDAGSELASRVIDGSEYRSFRVKEADRVTLDKMLRFLYLDEIPSAANQLGPLIRVCHFLQIESFMPHLVAIVKKAINEKTMTKEEWRELHAYLIEFDCAEAYEATVQHYVKPSDQTEAEGEQLSRGERTRRRSNSELVIDHE